MLPDRPLLPNPVFVTMPHGPKPAYAEVMLAGHFECLPEPHQTLFRLNPEAYRTYPPLAQDLAGEA
jgi:hypothetical protein